jgi:hypothetical protein
MRNYWPNPGAEDATEVPFVGNTLFGFASPGSAEFSTEMARSEHRSIKVTWPEPSGLDLAAVGGTLYGEGITGKWRFGCWVYVPSGNPDVRFGNPFATTASTSVKDEWVNIEAVINLSGPTTFVGMTTTSATNAAGIVYVDDIYAYPGEGNNPETEPEVLVDISWEGSLYNRTPEWDDITDYVQALSPKHGRPNEIGSAEAGTCQMVLDNGDGRFTPNRASSPYFPHIKPRRPVRVRALWDGASWPLFRGHVDRWPAETVTDSTNVTVELVDIFGVFSKKKLQDPYMALAKTYATREIYPMNDGPEAFAPTINPTSQNAVVFQPLGSGVAEADTGSAPSVNANAESIFPNGSGLGCLSVDGVAIAEEQPSHYKLTGRGVRFPFFDFDTSDTSAGWSISFWHSFEGLPPNDHGNCLVLRMEDSFSRMFLQVIFNANPFFKGYTVYWPDAGESGGFDLHYDSMADGFTNYKGKGNHVVLSFNNDCRDDGSNIPGLGLFVNGWGAYKEIPDSPFLGVQRNVRTLVGSQDTAKIHEELGANTIMSHDYRFGMFSIHDMPIDGWDLSLLRYRSGGNSEETPNGRVWYFLQQMGWDQDMTLLDDATADSALRFLNWDSSPIALDELRAPAADTNGLLFVNPAGYVAFQSRRLRQNPVAQLIFDHDAGTGIETPLNFDMSEQDIINVVNVDNAYGVKTEVRNDASVAYYDEVEQEKSLRLVSDAEAVQFGYYLVNRFGEAQLRIDSVVVNPAAHATGGLWGHVLSGSLSTAIGLRNLPGNAPDAAADYFIESVAHEIERSGDRLYWITTYQVSPATNREAWVLGHPTYSVLGETTRLHY